MIYSLANSAKIPQISDFMVYAIIATLKDRYQWYAHFE